MMRTLTLLAAGLVACFSTASAQLLRGTPSPGVSARIATLGPGASHWKLGTLRPGGPLNSLRGDVLLVGDTPTQKALDFVARHGALFGVVPSVTLGEPRVMARFAGVTADAPTSARALRLPQLVQGAALAGHGLTLEFDRQGEFVQAHGVVSEGAAALPAPSVSVSQAIDTALQHLASLGHSIGDLRAGPNASLVARLAADGPHLLHSIEVVLRLGAQPFAVEVDAHDGSVFALRDLAQHGTGTFRSEGQQISFQTGTGKGTVYKSLKHAVASKPSTGKLTEVGVQDVVMGLAEDGFLFGRFLQVIDDTLSVAFSPTHTWTTGTDEPASPADLTDPDAPGQFFDHSNTYSWMTRTASYMEKVFGPLGTDYALPAIVNVEGLLNAFYSGGDLGLGHGPGFFAFGDADAKTGDFNDDLSRDPTVSSHEYTHGVVEKFLLAFGDNDLDTPPRALNEAVADYFAASFHKTPCIGPQFMAFLGQKLDGLEGDCLRDLSEVRRMPLDLFDVLGETNLPEEHEAGVIFGSTLYRVGMALKQKKGDLAIAGALFAFPESTAEVGFPVVTVGNAQEAYQAYFGVALWALLDGIAEELPAGLVGKALGAAMQLGAVGDADAGSWWLADLSDGGKAGFKSELLPGISNHSLGIFVKAGQTITIKIKGLNGTPLEFDSGVFKGAITETQAPVINATGTSLSWKGLQATEDSVLVIVVGPGVPAGGPYKLLISVKG